MESIVNFDPRRVEDNHLELERSGFSSRGSMDSRWRGGHHYIFLSASHRSTKEARSPDACQTPHPYPPAAIETLQTLALSSSLLRATWNLFPKDFVRLICSGRLRGHPFLIHDVPHRPQDTTVSLRRRYDGFDLWRLCPALYRRSR
jgi:hypothetical protein